MEFTKQDAAALIAHAQMAPLANLKHAEQVSQLLQRFAAWHAKQIYHPAPTLSERADDCLVDPTGNLRPE